MNLQQMLPPEGIDAIAAQLGIGREDAARGAAALMPAILGGMGDRAGGTAGAGAPDLEAELAALGGPGLADNVIGSEPTDVARGNQLLGNIFGTKDVSRQVASHAAQSSGLDPALLKRMLPILAMLAAGYLTKQSGSQQGGLGAILGTVLGGLTGGGGALGGGMGGGSGGGALGGGLGDILGSVLGNRR